MPKYLYCLCIILKLDDYFGGFTLRHRHGNSSIGLEISKFVLSEFLRSSYKSRWRIGNDIKQCSLCGKCEMVCYSSAITVSRHNKTWTLNNRRCNQCLKCVMTCPTRCLTQVRLWFIFFVFLNFILMHLNYFLIKLNIYSLFYLKTC